MAEIRTVTTLLAKREEIQRAIVGYEASLQQARADLSHINAVISIFEAAGETHTEVRAYVDLHRLFAHGEMMRLCKEALASAKSTKELALIFIAAKGPRYRRQGAGARHGDAHDPRVAATVATRASRRRGEGEGRQGVGDQVLAPAR
jgi:hypothetical protein